MDRYSYSDINKTEGLPVKNAIPIGTITVVPLDKTIVEKMGIDENTFFEQILTDNGILLRTVRNN